MVGSGVGTGLGLSMSRQTAIDHGGRMTVESQPFKGTTVRLFLPITRSPVPAAKVVLVDDASPPQR